MSLFRYTEYDESLRYDLVVKAIDEISEKIKETYENHESDYNSLVKLLGVNAAEVTSEEISGDTKIMLSAIETLNDRVNKMNTHRNMDMHMDLLRAEEKAKEYKKTIEEIAAAGNVPIIEHRKHGIGIAIDKTDDKAYVRYSDGTKAQVPVDIFDRLSSFRSRKFESDS